MAHGSSVNPWGFSSKSTVEHNENDGKETAEPISTTSFFSNVPNVTKRKVFKRGHRSFADNDEKAQSSSSTINASKWFPEPIQPKPATKAAESTSISCGTKVHHFTPEIDRTNSYRPIVYQHICFDARFAGKSQEELRYEDRFGISATHALDTNPPLQPMFGWNANPPVFDWNASSQINSGFGNQSDSLSFVPGLQAVDRIDQKEDDQNAMDIDNFIVDQVSMKYKVSRDIARRCLECSKWDVDVAVNKIRALQRFGFDGKSMPKNDSPGYDDGDSKEKDEDQFDDISGNANAEMRRLLTEIQALKVEIGEMKKKEKEVVNAEEYNNVKVEVVEQMVDPPVDQLDLPDMTVSKEAADNAFSLLFGAQ